MLTAVGGGGRRACGGSCADGRGITRPWRRSAAHHRCRRRNHRPYVLSVLRPRVLTCSAPLRSPISASRHPFSRATVAVSPAPPRRHCAAGNVNIRGKMLTGVIKTTKMKNTVIIRKDFLHYIKKYNRFEKRHKNTPVHVSPAFRVKPGDEILAGQCRPLSKTVRFNMLKMIRAAGGDKKGFGGM